MSPSAEPSRLSGHRGEPSAPTTQENQPGEFEKAWREKVHNGKWEKICAATAKCDQCQLQGREVLQKCSSCTWSICRECSAAIPGSLKNKTHKLDDNVVDWDAPPKKNSANSKNTTTRRAKRAKTANKVERTLMPVKEQSQASGISGHGKGQILPLPLKGKAHKAIQTMAEISFHPPYRYLKSFDGDEYEIVAGMLTRRQSSNSLNLDRQENPSTKRGSLVPARIFLPHPSTVPYLPSPHPSGHSLQLQYTTGRITHNLLREPLPSHIKPHQHPTVRHESPEPLPWLAPIKERPKVDGPSPVCLCGLRHAHDRHASPSRESSHGRRDRGKQTCLEPGPPRPYQTLRPMRQEFTPTRVCEEEPSRGQPAPERFTNPRNLTSQCQEYHETKSTLGKRGRPTSTSPEPEVNGEEPYPSRAPR
ncbi:hypothetical protein J3459_017340 [Metarhizium acridum]|uniref:Uncharacterized protein n=1 Tax=Metarhizium acridum (strain CQMa 102) TaxID=655827 RepID=E9EBA2_METAQ|nr:uncharacterized protein MAC_07150 [Metarhizium acridum CQMa 102]EFY86835.1 hypothetical protein MAC_07150 [Metarhizium acridum CQMa 102]KAG8410164.1 hypothetical protein J3459_017340 [Metarhizium acridum]KAG8410490.1 hypothetical protein J3458_017248 [Metarhizium acridum]